MHFGADVFFQFFDALRASFVHFVLKVPPEEVVRRAEIRAMGSPFKRSLTANHS